MAMPVFLLPIRNTPTCVGKTFHFVLTYQLLEKHPHLRGEDMHSNAFLFLGLETPPPAWGRLNRQLGPNHRIGNTPTCVGKTMWPLSCCMAMWKHPHLRGEDDARKGIEPQGGETPPPAWGRLPSGGAVATLSRNTPTCVGKTNTSRYHRFSL